MNNFFDANTFSCFDNCNININKLLVILLLLTGTLDIEAIHIYRNNFIVSLGTFNEE